MRKAPHLEILADHVFLFHYPFANVCAGKGGRSSSFARFMGDLHTYIHIYAETPTTKNNSCRSNQVSRDARELNGLVVCISLCQHE
jgi:hypothetical protein